jgi:hypothetical protein
MVKMPDTFTEGATHFAEKMRLGYTVYLSRLIADYGEDGPCSIVHQG